MEDSELSSDFAVNFLNWDEDDIAGTSSGASDNQKNIAIAVKAPAQATTRKEQISNQNMSGIRSCQYLIPRGHPAGTLMPNIHSNMTNFSGVPQMGVAQPTYSQNSATASILTSNSATSSMTNTQSSSPSQPSNSTATTHSSFPMHTTVVNATQLHPLAIQASANCPPHISGILPAAPPNQQFISPFMYNPLLQTANTPPNQHFMTIAQAPNGQQQHLTQQQLPPQQQQLAQAQAQQQQHAQQQQQQQDARSQLTAHFQQQQQQQQQHISQQPANQQQHQQLQQHLQPTSATPSVASHPLPAPTPPSATVESPQKPGAIASSTNVGSQPSVTTAPQTQPGTNKPLPPFYLFDAPCELRTNFMASQRMHNLPIIEDNNSFHYGMAVNGFHPQLNAQVNPVLPLPRTAIPASSVQLIDGRSKKNRKAGKERNEREQKRAQKITELIEQLRVLMEQGGWKVEMKSKYHTLSTCADYVQNLMKTTKEKQDAVDKAKSELEIKERKMEEAARSDPESVTSSLTTSSSDSPPNEEPATTRKRSKSPSGRRIKKAKTGNKSQEEAESNNNTSRIGEHSGPRGRNISLQKMTSSTVSDISDSNRGSSEGEDNNNKEGSDSGNSISSSAADVAVKRKTLPIPRKIQESISIDADFELDYEEVFVSSNVPQLIATTAGRIMTCNYFFEKVTGLSKEEISRLTIFSIVQGDKLSSLFQILGETLRNGRKKAEDISTSAELVSNSSGETNNDYEAMTLPCVSFPSRTHEGKNQHPNPLFMTMTLMNDKDPRRRCFHCIITDHPGRNGQIGYVTPELLKLLFVDNVFAAGSKQVSVDDASSTGKDVDKSKDAEKEAVESQNIEDSTMIKSCDG